MEKPINGYPNYTVDEHGVVRNTQRGTIVAQQTYAGYKKVALWRNGTGKWHSVHRLVAQAFVPNPQNFPCVNHKDENKLNNHVGNLEWCDYLYNNTYGKNAPLKKACASIKKKVAMFSVDGALITVFESSADAERQTGINQSNIRSCCLQKKHFRTAGGYCWKFQLN